MRSREKNSEKKPPTRGENLLFRSIAESGLDLRRGGIGGNTERVEGAIVVLVSSGRRERRTSLLRC